MLEVNLPQRMPLTKGSTVPTPNWTQETISVAGIDVYVASSGHGPPLLVLHDASNQPLDLPYLQSLAEHFQLYLPHHPGFGVTPRLEWITSIADLAVFDLWLLEELGLQSVHLLGHAVGGWLAAEMATICPHLVDRLVLADAMGIKPQQGEIFDLFLHTPQEIQTLAFHNPEQVPEWDRLYGQAPTPEATDRAEEALETLVRLTWKPYMHNPRLPFLLPRIHRPTLIVWGGEDAIVPRECGERYHQGIAGSQLVVLDACGHHPHLEQPQAFTDAVRAFLSADTR
jgi:pimeloyl-ACP methyl ester carboxylesterase